MTMFTPVTDRVFVDEGTCHRLLGAALERGGDFAELYFEHTESTKFVLEDGVISGLGKSIAMGLGVRVLRGSSTGYAYCEEFRYEDMLAAARTAGEIVAHGGCEDAIEATPHATPRHATPPPYDAGCNSLREPIPDKLSAVRAAASAAREYDTRIVCVQVAFAEQFKQTMLVNSLGQKTSDRLPLIRFGVTAVAREQSRQHMGASSGGGRCGLAYLGQDFDVAREHGREAARIALVGLAARPAPAGELPVVLAAASSGLLLHEAVGHGLEGDFNRSGASRYSGRLDEMVASPLCHVVDDGTLYASRGSINVDDEGTPSARNTLIENGRLVSYLHDRLSAQHFGAALSGNGRRQSFRSMPLPRMTNTSLLPGDHHPDEIVTSVARGIYVTGIGGGQVNISNGDFSFSVTEGYLIENGKLTTPLHGLSLLGNGPDVLQKIDMVGDDYKLSDGMWTCGKEGQAVPVGIGTPTVRVSSLTCGGTAT